MQMINYQGKCSCKKAVFSLKLPEKLESYSPRACDCNFCVQHQLAYLSDPKGQLNVSYQGDFTIIKQGSEQAQFLCCDVCGNIIAVVYQFENNILKGAVNANLLIEAEKMLPSTTVSPKLLAPDEKLERWEQLWLKVKINGGG